jgi:hypothetical protein
VPKRGKHILDWTRRLLAGVLLVSSAALSWNRLVCGDELATTGGQGVVRLCRPLAITDPPILGALLLILLLLLPDLSEIGIPGFLSLKRQVQEQESKLGEQEGKLAALNAQLTQAIGLEQATTQDVDTRANAMSVNVLDIAGVLRRFETKAESELLAASGREEHSNDVVPAARAQLESRLLRIWARLEPPTKISLEYWAARDRAAGAEAELRNLDRQRVAVEGRLARLHKEDPAAVETNELESLLRSSATLAGREGAFQHMLDQATKVLARTEGPTEVLKWGADFRQELQVVRAAYDALIHGESIEDSKLSAAVRLAEGLLEAWNIRSGITSEVADITADDLS